MRAQGILLVRDAILLLRALPTDGECHAPTPSISPDWNLTSLAPASKFGLWWQSCNRALASLEEFSQHLLSNLKRFREYGNKSGADMISSSCITCLAHLAILYEAVCRTDPTAEETYSLCDFALQRLGVLTSEFRLDEYTYLDLLLGVCPHLRYFLVIMTQRDAGLIGLLEQITTGF